MIVIDEILVKKLIKSQFPQWSNLEIKPVLQMGHDNRTFHLGDTMSVRLPSDECYAFQSEKEQFWLPRFLAHLPLEIPHIIKSGNISDTFPYPWSVCSWIEGETVNRSTVSDMVQLAKDLANFLVTFESLDCRNGPVAGKHNFFRGGDLSVYDKETKDVLSNLPEDFDEQIIKEIWKIALESKWSKEPVWVHGDITPTNMLVKNGKLTAIIDFGILGIGDPACDLAMYWTYFEGDSKSIFKQAMNLDEDTWNRARGWVLWKSLLTFDEYINKDKVKANEAKRIINNIVKEYSTMK